MALSEYNCPHGHVLDVFHLINARPESVRCEAHGCDAPRNTRPHLVAVGGVTPVHDVPEWTPEERAAKQAPPTLTEHVMRCDTCDDTYTMVNDWREGPPTSQPCSRCAGTALVVPGGLPDPGLRRYPYFDRGLQLTLTSEAHRRQVCKERGLIPIEGDWDWDRDISEKMKPYDEAEAYMADLRDRQEHAPEWAQWRRMRDLTANEGKSA